MQIRKYALGGFNYIPLTSIEQAQAEQAAQQKAASSAPAAKKAEKASEVAKDALDMIKTHGLESDVNAFLDDWQNVLAMANDPNGENINLQQVIAMQRRAVKVKNNYDNFKQATENLSAQDAWQDVAVTSTGRLYVTKDGKLTTMSMEEYSKGDHGASVITNQYLAELRESRPEFKYNMDIINDLKNAVGFNKVIDQAMKIVNAFGTSEQSAYTTKEGSKIAKGLEKLIGGGPDGVYKVTTKAQLTADRDAQAALNYLYNALPIAYRRTLSAYSAAQGGKPGSQDDLMILAQMIQRNVDDSVSVNYEKTPTDDAKKGSGKGSGESSTMKEQTLGEAYQYSDGFGNRHISVVQSSKTGVKMKAMTQDYGALVDNNNKMLSDASVLDTFTLAKELGASANLDAATFGNMRLSREDLSKVMVNQIAGLKGVDLPVKVDRDGAQVVDFELFNTIDELQKEIDKRGLTPGQKKGIVESNPKLMYDAANNEIVIRPEYMKSFYVLNAYAGSRNLSSKGQLSDNEWVRKLTGDEEKNVIDRFNKVTETEYSTGSTKGISTGRKKQRSWNDIYQGSIFIPKREGTQATAIYSGQEFLKSTWTNIDAQYAAHQARQGVDSLRSELESQGAIRLNFN